MTYGNCIDCIFWRDAFSQRFKAPNQQVGKCHAHAPTLIQTATIGVTHKAWPETHGQEGCGDFQKAAK